jgi:hypothetical protein
MNNVDFASIIGEVPALVKCPDCGIETMRLPCWDCDARKARDRHAAKALDRMGIPARFAWARLDAPELPRRVCPVGASGEPVRLSAVVDAVRAWGGPAVLFAGPSGTGKTSLAIALIRDVPGAMVVTASALERANIETRAGTTSELVARACRARCLLIDDLGQDKTTSFSAVEGVINHRHNTEAPTWVTTGLSAEQVEARYGAGVRRRLNERRVSLVIKFAPKGTP